MEGMRRISNNYYFRQIVACVLVGCLFFNSVPAAFAGPGGANVVAGSAAVGQGGNTTTVTMGSAQAVINWDSLNTNSNEVLQFLKASGGFAVLNRIVQGGATQFDGSLFGNQGHILIVNPQGIVFGPTALVQAYKFTAAGLDISDTDFMNGHYQFIGGDGVGAVSNYGSISAEQVALIGKQVLNAGIISSPGGYVVMAAGDKVFLGQEDSNVLVEVEGVTVPAATDAAGIGDVINEGTIEAAGGKIVLAAGDTFSRAVEGLDSLSLAVESGNGRVGQFGTLNADGVEGDGGSITMTAGDVVALSSDSLTTANAGTNGDGGEVIAYSPETALFREGAQIQAKGGTESGDGGFIEVSGKNHVEINGFVNASASHGSAGTFLIDPTDITVQAGAGDITDDTDGSFTTNANTNTVQDTVIEGYLDAGTNVILDTSDYGANPGPYAGAGDITISAAIDPSAGSNSGDVTLTLYAADDIAVNAAIDGTGLGGSKLNVDLRANQVVAHFGDDPNPAAGDVSIGAAVTTAGGSFTSSGVDFDNTGGIITTGGGAIAVNHTGTVTLGADLDPGAGSMSGTATSINVASNLAEIQDAIDIAGGTTISVSDGTYNENLTVNKSDITLKSVNGPGSTTLTATNGVVVDVEGGGDNFTLGGASGEGFSIDSGANSTFLVQLANAPQDVEISWNELDTTGNASQGISVGAAGATGLNINNNDFVAGELVDGSIWGPYVVDVSVTDNTFTGPVAKAASGYAVQFAGVTGTSVIQDNIINDYGMGIAIFNGTGTSGLTIQGNSVTDCTTGIRLGQYSPGVNGDMDDVTITANTLTDNTTGLQINNGANVKPSGFSVTNNFFVNNTTGVESQHSSESATIYENSFSGNTTAVSNTGALAMLDAEGNWWGHATGPSGAGPGSGDAVSTKVDYSPWLGIGTDGDLGTPGFQMASPMTWWGNGSIQAIIDAASSGDTVNVVADTYVENVNVNKGLAGLNFMGASASEIQGDLELTNDSSNWDGGDLGISTQNQDLTLNSGTNHVTTDTGDHSLTLDTGTATTYLQGEVTVGGDLTLMSNAESSEDMILEAGDSIYAHGTLTTTAVGPDDGFGNIELSASGSTIHLYGNVNADVTDDGDIILHSHSVIDDGVVLTAGKDVTNLGLMEAEGDLTIVATDGGIESADVLMKADGKTLSLTQNDSLNMENAFDDVINSDDTDLVADSTAGSFTETKAPRWQTIAADAQTYILLDDTDSPGNITTKALTTTDGDILITSNLGKVYATGPISAGNDVKITAKNEASDAIFLDENVDADRDIWLNNNTWAADDVQIDAVQDVRVGWNEIQERYDPKTLTGDGDLRVEAGRHITLGGDVTADGYLELMADYDFDNVPYEFDDGVGDMTAHGSVETTNGYLHVIGKNIQIDGTVDAAGSIDMWAADNITLDNSVESDFYMQLYADWDPGIWDYDDDGIGPDVGDMWAKSTLDSLGSYIEIKAADSTINLDDDVTASTDILLRDNTVVAAGKTLDAGRDVTVGYGTADGTTLTGEGALTVEADRHITLGGAVDASSLTPANLVLWADKDNSGTPGGDMIAYGSLTNPGGDIEIHSADSTSELWDDVILSGDFVMYNDTEMKAAGKIIQSTGDDVILMGGKTLDSDYDLTIDAFDDIILGVTTIAFATHETTGGTGTAGNVSAAGDMTMTAGDAIYAHGTLTTTAGGDIELSALGSSTIHLYDDVEADIATDGDIILHSNTEVAAGKHLWAGQDITLDDGKSLNGDGSLDIFAERHITLGGPVAADGNMRLYADFDIGPDDFAENNIGKMHAKSSLTTTGTDSDLYVYGQDIQVDGDVDSSGDILMGAADDITLGDLVSEDSVTSVGDIYLLADLEASTIDPLNPQFDNADLDEDGVGKLWAKSTITLTGSDLYAYGQDIEVDGEVDSSGMVVMGAANSITLDEDVTAAGDMYLYADFDADAGVMGEFVEDSDGGDLVADGSLETTGTGNDIYAYGKNITVDGDVDSSGMIVMGAAHDITLGDDVLYDSVEAVGDIWLLADLDASNINPVDPQLTDNDYLDENGDGDVHAKSTITTTGSDVIVYGQNIEVDGYVDSSGMIVMGAANNITLDAWVKSVGDMYLYADLDADAGVMGEFVEGTDGGDMTADEYLQTTGSGSDIIVYGQNIRVDGDVTSNGDILMGAEDNITLGDLVSEDDVTAQGDIYLLADLDASNINPLAPDLPANTDFAEGGDGNVLAQSNIAANSSDVIVYGQNIEVDGTVYSDGMIVMAAADDITLHDWVKSVDDMYLYADYDADDTTFSMGKFVETDSPGGDMTADEYLQTTGSGSDIIVYGQNIQVDGDVTSNGDILMGAEDNITLGTDDSEDDVTAQGDIYLLADLDASNINPLAPDLPANTDFAEGGDGNVLAQSNIAANSSDVIVYGQNIEVDGTVYSDGMIVMAAADNITLDDWVESVGDMYLYADYDADAGSAMGEFVEDNVGKMWAKSSLTTTGSDITVYGQDIQVDGDVDSSGMIVMGAADDITLGDNVSEDSVEAVGDIWLLADLDASSIDPVDPQLTDNDYLDENGDGDVHAKSTITTTGSDVIVYGENIEVDGYVDSSGMIVMGAADNITLDDWVQSVGDMYLYSDFDADAGVMGAFVEDNVGHMWAKSTLTSTGGQIDISAADNTIKLDDDVTADEDILLRNSTVVAGGKTLKSTNDDVVLAGGKYLSYSGAGGTLTVEAGDDIIFGVDDVDNHWDNPQNPLNGTPGNVTSNGDLILTAGDDIYAHGWLQTFNGGDIIATATDDVYVYGDIYADGDIEIYSDNTTTNLFGDLIQAVGNILLDNNTIFGSGVDQLVDAQTGGITANGSLQKPNESLYLEAAGNVSLDGPVTANNGGVSIISETGTIFTPDGLGDPTDTLNVPISGYSDDAAGDGVVLPYGPGRAAIVIMSAETLNVGPLAVLSADGIYDTTGAVDDRAGVDFLDAPGAYIPLPGGPLRDEGDPFDAAIYVASTTGNVDVSSPVTITSTEWINEEPFPVPGGAMVIDAWDTVTFDGGVPGGLFEQSLAGSNVGSYVGDRLEVCSRITEWLFQAYNNGRLPYVYGGGPFPDGYDYVLRGAGLGNPSISTTGSTVAWVLEDPIEPAPFGEDLIPGTEEVAFGEGGCPVLMAWLAEELGIPEETIQVYLADAFLYSTAIQPCEACARLLEAATVLEDLEGTRIAALAQVVNEFVAPDAPIAPEQMASIASAMVSPEAGTYYAAGGEWLDALAAYVSILSAEMGFSVPESVAFVNKYLTPVAELDNASLAAYVEARLAALGG